MLTVEDLTQITSIVETALEPVLAKIATKEDLASVQESLQDDMARIVDVMATKEDIVQMATKDDISEMATKDDISEMVTKDDFAFLNKRIDLLTDRFDGFLVRMDRFDDLRLEYIAVSTQQDRHEKWIHELADKTKHKLKY